MRFRKVAILVKLKLKATKKTDNKIEIKISNRLFSISIFEK